MTAYQDKLKDPRWQRKRLEILSRDGWRCTCCGDADSTLHVHHGLYARHAEPWEYPDNVLWTLCESCHEENAESFQHDSRLELARMHPSLWGEVIQLLYGLRTDFETDEAETKRDLDAHFAKSPE